MTGSVNSTAACMAAQAYTLQTELGCLFRGNRNRQERALICTTHQVDGCASIGNPAALRQLVVDASVAQ
jgi:hypothetical protein